MKLITFNGASDYNKLNHLPFNRNALLQAKNRLKREKRALKLKNKETSCQS